MAQRDILLMHLGIYKKHALTFIQILYIDLLMLYRPFSHYAPCMVLEEDKVSKSKILEAKKKSESLRDISTQHPPPQNEDITQKC